jgi:hypothetical protein
LIGAVVALLAAGIGAFWFIADFTSTGLRQDVSAIRATLARETASIRAQVGALNTSLDRFGTKMDELGTKLDGADTAVRTLSGRMEGDERCAPLLAALRADNTRAPAGVDVDLWGVCGGH